MAGTRSKATAIGGLPVPVAAIALPCPARPCSPDLESRNLNRLRLISFRLARTRADASAPFTVADVTRLAFRLARTRADAWGEG
jgi:hypothetical protein